jgi:hypothetical protein
VLLKKVVGSTTTIYVGNYYEKTGSVIRKYYYFAGQRVAMRSGSTVYYLVTDHLGSTSKTLNSSGGVVAELRYKPYGDIRRVLLMTRLCASAWRWQAHRLATPLELGQLLSQP